MPSILQKISKDVDDIARQSVKMAKAAYQAATNVDQYPPPGQGPYPPHPQQQPPYSGHQYAPSGYSYQQIPPVHPQYGGQPPQIPPRPHTDVNGTGAFSPTHTHVQPGAGFQGQAAGMHAASMSASSPYYAPTYSSQPAQASHTPPVWQSVASPQQPMIPNSNTWPATSPPVSNPPPTVPSIPNVPGSPPVFTPSPAMSPFNAPHTSYGTPPMSPPPPAAYHAAVHSPPRPVHSSSFPLSPVSPVQQHARPVGSPPAHPVQSPQPLSQSTAPFSPLSPPPQTPPSTGMAPLAPQTTGSDRPPLPPRRHETATSISSDVGLVAELPAEPAVSGQNTTGSPASEPPAGCVELPCDPPHSTLAQSPPNARLNSNPDEPNPANKQKVEPNDAEAEDPALRKPKRVGTIPPEWLAHSGVSVGFEPSAKPPPKAVVPGAITEEAEETAPFPTGPLSPPEPPMTPPIISTANESIQQLSQPKAVHPPDSVASAASQIAALHIGSPPPGAASPAAGTDDHIWNPYPQALGPTPTQQKICAPTAFQRFASVQPQPAYNAHAQPAAYSGPPTQPGPHQQPLPSQAGYQGAPFPGQHPQQHVQTDSHPPYGPPPPYTP